MTGFVDRSGDGTCREVQAKVEAAELVEDRGKCLDGVGVVPGVSGENDMRLIVVVLAGSTMNDDGGVELVLRRRDREVCESADRRFVRAHSAGGQHGDDDPTAYGQQSESW